MAVTFLEPGSLHEAAALLGERGPRARLLGGGTALMLMMQRGDLRPAAFISLGRVAGQDFVHQGPDGLRIGALTRLREVERSPAARAFCPALCQAFGAVGNVRIRHQATAGGSLAGADFAVDPPTVLLGLGARLRAVDALGRDEHLELLPYLDGLRARGGADAPDPRVLAEIVVPPLPPRARATYLRFTPRSAEARPCVTVAALAELDGRRCRSLRVAVGAAVAVPRRLPEIEARAVGHELTDGFIEHLAEAHAAGLPPSGESAYPPWYRTRMIRVFVRRALTALRDEEARHGAR